MMSFVAETFIFLYVGMDALDIEKWKMSKLRYNFILLFAPVVVLSALYYFSDIFLFGCSFGTSISIWSTLILLISIGRAAFVFPLSGLSNYMNRPHSERASKITFKHMVSCHIYKTR